MTENIWTVGLNKNFEFSLERTIEILKQLDNLPKLPPPLRVMRGDYLTPIWKQIIFPKSKKKRIREKFKKNQKNYAYVKIGFYDKINNIIFLPPDEFDNLNY